ncbi:MAG: hypothetical protein RMJ55_20040, partial [Roseiflexaceae bacterium]|nr:hypothetical protein [Roseiflexaceae bacterium]
KNPGAAEDVWVAFNRIKGIQRFDHDALAGEKSCSNMNIVAQLLWSQAHQSGLRITVEQQQRWTRPAAQQVDLGAMRRDAHWLKIVKHRNTSCVVFNDIETRNV